MELKRNQRSYSPNRNGNTVTGEETGKFLPVSVEPGLDSLGRNPEDVDFMPQMEEEAPNDRFRLVFIIFLIHGIGILMPWNMLINAKDYFEQYKLGKNDTEVTKYREEFMFYLGIFSQVPNFLMSGVNTFCQCGGQASPRRIVVAIGVMVIVFICTVILAMIDTADWAVEFFWLTMLTAVVLNLATGVYQNSSFGLAASLPMKYTNAIVLGNNLSGVFIAVVNIICLFSAPDPRTQAIYYFVAAIAVLLIAFDGYFLLPLCKFYRFYQKRTQVSHSSTTRTFGQTCSQYGTVFKKIWVQALCVWFVFFVSLTCFPGIWSNVQRLHIPMSNAYWVSIFCFLSFNLFAFLGNLSSEFIKVPSAKYVWIPILIRGLLIPFFILSNFKPETRLLPVVIANDYVFIVGGVVLAFTSGYFSSLNMMYGPTLVDSEVAGIAGRIMAFCLVTGIVTGVNFSLALASLTTVSV